MITECFFLANLLNCAKEYGKIGISRLQRRRNRWSIELVSRSFRIIQRIYHVQRSPQPEDC